MSKWKPIESAPKDGTKILACNAKSGEIAVVHWDVVSMNSKEGWQISVVCTNWNYYEELRGATHWMPMPELPDAECDSGHICHDAYRIAGELFERLKSAVGFGTLTMTSNENVVSYIWEFNCTPCASEKSRRYLSQWNVPLHRFASLRPLRDEAAEVAEQWKNSYRKITQ